jgi:glucose/arabinose dehydrogenase
MKRALTCAIVLGLAFANLVNTVSAAITGLERVASGLSNPIYATHAPGDRDRLFIVQRSGSIRILNLNSGQLETNPFLSISGVDQAGEGGLLGLAFDPDYANNGKFYVDVTIDNGGQVLQGAVSPFSTEIRQYSVSDNPNLANPTPTPVLSIVQPQSNHDGGWIGFSPKDGYLYVAMGDGGGGNDLDFDGDSDGHTAGTGNAQDITDNLLGKMLRINVDGDDFPADANRNYAIPSTNPFVDVTGDDEIWAYGLRNPFRDSFDRLNGDLWIGDVGQNSREEIDFQAADSSGGENYGWRLREGTIATPTGGVGGDPPAGSIEPVYDYTHGSGSFQGNAVIGGYVYRGPDPTVQGQYFFADEVSSHKWMRDPTTEMVTNVDGLLAPDIGSVSNPAAFGEDAVGNLYVVAYGSGSVYRIATNELLPGDYDADGDVDDDDYAAWKTSFGAIGVGLDADGNGDGVVNAADYTVWRNNLGRSVHDLGAGSASVSVPEPVALMFLGQILGFGVFGTRRRGGV